MKKLIVIVVLLSVFLSACETLLQQIKSAFGGQGTNITENIAQNLNQQVKDVIETQIDKNLKKLLEETKSQIEKSYTVTDFNYAISFGDNASYLENKQDYKNIATYTYYLIDPNVPKHIQARNYNTSGQIMYVTNSYQMAEFSLTKALELYKEINYLDSTEAILTMNNLGLLYLNMGKYKSSEEYFNQALEHHKKNPRDTVGLSATLNNLGVLYKINGEYTKSENFFKQALDNVQQRYGSNSIQYAVILNNLAMLNVNINKLDEAQELMEQCIAIAEKNFKENSTTLQRFRTNLALIYRTKKDYKTAEKILLNVLERLRKRLGDKHPDYATLLRSIASLYMEMEYYAGVEKNLTEALQIYERKFGKQNPQYANTLFELAVYNQFVGRIDLAQSQFIEALETQKATLSPNNPAIARTNEYLAINYWHQNDIPNAFANFQVALDKYIFLINNFFDAMSDAEKTLFWADYQTSFIRFFNFVAQNFTKLPQMATVAYDYHLQTKAILLNNSRKLRSLILSSNDKQLIAQYEQLNELKNYIARLYSFTNEELKERKINLDSIVRIAENLEKQIILKSSEYSRNIEQRNINAMRVKNQLNSNEVAIEILRLPFYRFEKPIDSVFYAAMILYHDNLVPQIVCLENGPQMETDYYQQYAKAIGAGTDTKQFYYYYWEKIDKLITNKQKIFLSVDGIFNRVNVNTFQLPDGKYVIDKYIVYNLTNTKDIISLKERIETKTNLTGKTAILIGNPNYSLGLPQGYNVIPPLPGTKVEVEEISKLLNQKRWKYTVLQQDNAREEELKKINSPFVVHIATHGYFVETTTIDAGQTRTLGVNNERAISNPLLRSGLLFAGADVTYLNINDKDNTSIDDGILNAFESMTIDLNNTHLVVLSACQTGLGDIKTGEGVYGLQRAFQIAGTRSIITSLWPVSDQGTQMLMTQFYKNWLDSGNEFEAFRNASLYIKDKLKYPYFWGAFVLVGR